MLLFLIALPILLRLAYIRDWGVNLRLASDAELAEMPPWQRADRRPRPPD